jgi:hypothetical protein
MGHSSGCREEHKESAKEEIEKKKRKKEKKSMFSLEIFLF